MSYRAIQSIIWIFIAIALQLPLSFGSESLAEPAYRWTDAGGHTTYGSNPPANARNVEQIKPRTFSKYSSSRLLRAYGKKTEPAVKESTIAPIDSPAAQAEVKDSKEIIPEVIKVPQPAQLDHGEVDLDRNDKNEITRCEVKVKNYGEEKAGAIKVSFQFADGTLIQAQGPESMLAQEEALFQVTKKHLPIRLKDAAQAELPEVILDFSSMPQ